MENEKNKGEVKKMAVLTAKCSQAFRVSPEKSKSFLEHKTSEKTKIKMQGTLSKISSKLNAENDKT